jgi:hypothetical protein
VHREFFTILGGWGGVVLGYYFGRMPAEKAADKANNSADFANKNSADANKKKILAIAKCSALLESHEKSLRAIRDNSKSVQKLKIDMAPTPPELARMLDEINTEIEKDLDETSNEKQKILNMLNE